jgi:hypothetical protein
MNYEGNSFKQKQKRLEEEREQPKKVQKVVKNKVRVKKQSELDKLVDTMFVGRASEIGESLISDILIPAFKQTVSNLVTNGISMLLYNEKDVKTYNSGNIKRMNGSVITRTDYSTQSNNRVAYRQKGEIGGYTYPKVYFEDRLDADKVFANMQDQVERYDQVSVRAYCEMTGTQFSRIDEDYGWDKQDLVYARIRSTRDGWIINLPRPQRLEY